MIKDFNNIKKIFEKFSPFAPTNCGIYDTNIRFATTNVDGNLINICLPIGELSDDWYGDCESCPENDAIIQSLEISHNEKYEIVKGELLNNFTFEDMMKIIEEVWP